MDSRRYRDEDEEVWPLVNRATDSVFLRQQDRRLMTAAARDRRRDRLLISSRPASRSSEKDLKIISQGLPLPSHPFRSFHGSDRWKCHEKDIGDGDTGSLVSGYTEMSETTSSTSAGSWGIPKSEETFLGRVTVVNNNSEQHGDGEFAMPGNHSETQSDLGRRPDLMPPIHDIRNSSTRERGDESLLRFEQGSAVICNYGSPKDSEPTESCNCAHSDLSSSAADFESILIRSKERTFVKNALSGSKDPSTSSSQRGTSTRNIGKNTVSRVLTRFDDDVPKYGRINQGNSAKMRRSEGPRAMDSERKTLVAGNTSSYEENNQSSTIHLYNSLQQPHSAKPEHAEDSDPYWDNSFPFSFVGQDDASSATSCPFDSLGQDDANGAANGQNYVNGHPGPFPEVSKIDRAFCIPKPCESQAETVVTEDLCADSISTNSDSVEYGDRSSTRSVSTFSVGDRSVYQINKEALFERDSPGQWSWGVQADDEDDSAFFTYEHSESVEYDDHSISSETVSVVFPHQKSDRMGEESASERVRVILQAKSSGPSCPVGERGGALALPPARSDRAESPKSEKIASKQSKKKYTGSILRQGADLAVPQALSDENTSEAQSHNAMIKSIRMIEEAAEELVRNSNTDPSSLEAAIAMVDDRYKSLVESILNARSIHIQTDTSEAPRCKKFCSTEVRDPDVGGGDYKIGTKQSQAEEFSENLDNAKKSNRVGLFRRFRGTRQKEDRGARQEELLGGCHSCVASQEESARSVAAMEPRKPSDLLLQETNASLSTSETHNSEDRTRANVLVAHSDLTDIREAGSSSANLSSAPSNPKQKGKPRLGFCAILGRTSPERYRHRSIEISDSSVRVGDSHSQRRTSPLRHLRSERRTSPLRLTRSERRTSPLRHIRSERRTSPLRYLRWGAQVRDPETEPESQLPVSGQIVALQMNEGTQKSGGSVYSNASSNRQSLLGEDKTNEVLQITQRLVPMNSQEMSETEENIEDKCDGEIALSVTGSSISEPALVKLGYHMTDMLDTVIASTGSSFLFRSSKDYSSSQDNSSDQDDATVEHTDDGTLPRGDSSSRVPTVHDDTTAEHTDDCTLHPGDSSNRVRKVIVKPQSHARDANSTTGMPERLSLQAKSSVTKNLNQRNRRQYMRPLKKIRKGVFRKKSSSHVHTAEILSTASRAASEIDEEDSQNSLIAQCHDDSGENAPSQSDTDTRSDTDKPDSTGFNPEELLSWLTGAALPPIGESREVGQRKTERKAESGRIPIKNPFTPDTEGRSISVDKKTLATNTLSAERSSMQPKTAGSERKRMPRQPGGSKHKLSVVPENDPLRIISPKHRNDSSLALVSCLRTPRYSKEKHFQPSREKRKTSSVKRVRFVDENSRIEIRASRFGFLGFAVEGAAEVLSGLASAIPDPLTGPISSDKSSPGTNISQTLTEVPVNSGKLGDCVVPKPQNCSQTKLAPGTLTCGSRRSGASVESSRTRELKTQGPLVHSLRMWRDRGSSRRLQPNKANHSPTAQPVASTSQSSPDIANFTTNTSQGECDTILSGSTTHSDTPTVEHSNTEKVGGWWTGDVSFDETSFSDFRNDYGNEIPEESSISSGSSGVSSAFITVVNERKTTFDVPPFSMPRKSSKYSGQSWKNSERVNKQSRRPSGRSKTNCIYDDRSQHACYSDDTASNNT